MKHFSTISSIIVDDKSTWKNKIFLTFDIDWAHDDVLNDTIDVVENTGVNATWFVTHDTPVLNRLRDNPKFELGIHPNFNYLLSGDTRNGGNPNEVIERLLRIVRDAKSIRSHSMTQNSLLLDLFKSLGLTHDANHFIPSHTNIQLKPWYLWNDLIRVPYNWEDDIACLLNFNEDMQTLACNNGLNVFDFHPIHVFLNTEKLDRYEKTRHLHQKPEELIKYRHEGVGARTRLIELLKLIGSSQVDS